MAKHSKLQVLALAAVGSLAGACGGALEAQDATGRPVPGPAPAVKPDEPVKPVAQQRPIDDGAIRALAEEVALLRAQIAEMKKDRPLALVEPVAGGVAASTPREPRIAAEPAEKTMSEADSDRPAPERLIEREVVVEREVPVLVDETVYVDSEIIVDVEPTVVIERVACGDDCCDQWIPAGHVHFIGCGHHYYGCSCHPWYYDLGPSHSLSFSFVHVDDDRHARRDPRPHRTAHRERSHDEPVASADDGRSRNRDRPGDGPHHRQRPEDGRGNDRPDRIVDLRAAPTPREPVVSPRLPDRPVPPARRPHPRNRDNGAAAIDDIPRFRPTPAPPETRERVETLGDRLPRVRGREDTRTDPPPRAARDDGSGARPDRVDRGGRNDLPQRFDRPQRADARPAPPYSAAGSRPDRDRPPRRPTRHRQDGE